MTFNDWKFSYPDNWRGRWEVIYEFIHEWFDAEFDPQPEADEIDEVARLEQSAGVVLPPSAREWCVFTLMWEQLESSFELRDIPAVERLKDHDAVSLLLQGEEDYYWAIESRFLDMPDPPVTGYDLDPDDPDGRFVERGPWAPSVSAFALDYLLTYRGCPGAGFSTMRTTAGFSRDALIADFGQPVVFGHLEIFMNRDVLAALSTFPENWHYDTVTVEMRQPIKPRKLPRSIQQLLKYAHVRRISLDEA